MRACLVALVIAAAPQIAIGMMPCTPCSDATQRNFAGSYARAIDSVFSGVHWVMKDGKIVVDKTKQAGGNRGSGRGPNSVRPGPSSNN